MEGIKKIADYYGLSKQQRQLSEECAELIQASSKYLRYREVSDVKDGIWEHIQDIVEEIADVEIMLEQFKYLMNISDEPYVIKAGDRIAQGAFFKFLVADNGNTDVVRVGGIGSTNK